MVTHEHSRHNDLPLNPSEPIIEATGLIKRYGSTNAVDGVDLQVMTGEIFGILGPNGAGKTTTLEMIEGLRTPDAGQIRVAGYDAVRENSRVRQLIGVQLQTTALFDYLKAAELIQLFAHLYEADASPARVDELLEMVGLQDKRDARVNQMSGGQQQRLSIALGLVNKPVVAFLDEPTTGLDPGARRDLWQTIQDIRAEGTTVVLTTHYMEEAEVLCDRVAIMDFGRIIALDTPRALVRGLGSSATIYAAVARGRLAQEEIAALPGVTAHDLDDGNVTVQTANVQATLVGLLDLATRSKVELTDLRSTQASLEDVFLELTGRTYAQGDEEEEKVQEAPSSRRRWGRNR